MYAQDLEGGCWVFQTDEGNYQLMGEKAQELFLLPVEGAALRVRGAKKSGLATICMTGAPFEISDYEIISLLT